MSAKLGNLQAVREGFANGGDPNHYVDWFGFNALKMAEHKGFDRIADYIRHGDNKREEKVLRDKKN